MTESEIEQALRDHLAGASGLPTIVWPNGDVNLPLPFVVVEVDRFTPNERNLARGDTMTGFLQASVLVAQGEWTSEAMTYAEIIVARFPAGLPLSAGDGTVKIDRRPAVLSGYPDTAINAWRLPVQVPYRAFT